MPRRPTWEDWLGDARTYERSMRYFRSPRVTLIKTLSQRIAEENVLGHLKKAYHNLDLANKIFTMHEGGPRFRYDGEDFFDWVITVCYYACIKRRWLHLLLLGRKERPTPPRYVLSSIITFTRRRG
nr:hypothetical protein [Candidatus Njordarchaeum guaymaensis]